MVFDGLGVVGSVRLKVLDIGLNHGMHVAHLGEEEVLALHHAVDNITE